MSGPTCATCRHFRDHADAECYRFPATIRVFPTHGCGEHTPAEPVGVPQLPTLPDGWEWDACGGVDDHGNGSSVMARAVRGGNWCSVNDAGRVDTGHVGGAPLAVVEAVIAAHRARGGA